MYARNPERFYGIQVYRALGGQSVEKGHIVTHVADAATTGASTFCSQDASDAVAVHFTQS